MTKDINYQMLKLIEQNPELSQRQLAEEMGVSLGKVNYCLRALIDKGLVKAKNFKNSSNKAAYLYLLTPRGVEAKAKISVRFLALKRMCRVGGNGFILRGVDIYDHIGSSLRPNSINRRLKELQKLAGLDLGGALSGHSFRVGAALDLLERGESLEKIMLRGGWRSESSTMKYLRAWQAV